MEWTTVKAPIHVIGNQKGGVGKTFTTSILCQYAAIKRGQRVLAIDLDMQCNVTRGLVGMEDAPEEIGEALPPKHPEYTPGVEWSERPTIADLFNDKPVIPMMSWLSEDVCNNGGFVEMLCGHPQELEDLINKYASDNPLIESKIHLKLREFLYSEEIQSAYDVIFIDTAPSRSPLLKAALRAASVFTIPFCPEVNDLQGISSMWQAITQENFDRPATHKINLTGIFPNKIDLRTKLHRINLDSLEQKWGKLLFPTECWLGKFTVLPERDLDEARPKSIFEMKDKKSLEVKALVEGTCEYIFDQMKEPEKVEVEA